MLVTGDREAAEGTVSVRSRSGGDLGARPVSGFIADALDEIERKAAGPQAPPAQAQSA
jgi:threonyl-tRNA synthetase